jgi:hypothetical protein
MMTMPNLRHVTAWRRKEAAVLAGLTPTGSTTREVRAMLKAALGAQYGAWVRLQPSHPLLHKDSETADNENDGG